jgi:hypothetical protein
MLTPEAYGRLINLLPKLAALTDKARLKALADIDRVLAAEGLTWTDIAAGLLAPALPVECVLAMLDRIAQQPDLLTDKARDFITQLRERASRTDRVFLSPRQSEWLYGLDYDAEHERQRREREQAPEPVVISDEGKSTLH